MNCHDHRDELQAKIIETRGEESRKLISLLGLDDDNDDECNISYAAHELCLMLRELVAWEKELHARHRSHEEALQRRRVLDAERARRFALAAEVKAALEALRKELEAIQRLARCASTPPPSPSPPPPPPPPPPPRTSVSSTSTSTRSGGGYGGGNGFNDGSAVAAARRLLGRTFKARLDAVTADGDLVNGGNDIYRVAELRKGCQKMVSELITGFDGSGGNGGSWREFPSWYSDKYTRVWGGSATRPDPHADPLYYYSTT